LLAQLPYMRIFSFKGLDLNTCFRGFLQNIN
jgi:hypothetical protein